MQFGYYHGVSWNYLHEMRWKILYVCSTFYLKNVLTKYFLFNFGNRKKENVECKRSYIHFSFHNSKTWTNKYHDVVVLYDVQRSIEKVVLDFSTSAEIQYYFFNTPLQTNIMNFVWSGVLKKWYWISALVLKSNTTFSILHPKVCLKKWILVHILLSWNVIAPLRAQKVLENITCGYGNHLWKYWIYHSWPSATRDNFNTFTRDYHNHA